MIFVYAELKKIAKINHERVETERKTINSDFGDFAEFR